MKLQDVKIPEGKNAWIICADVVAFYPSIPNDIANKALVEWISKLLIKDTALGLISMAESEQQKRWNYYKELFPIALKEPVMTYLDKIYVQHKGLPMGAAGSPDVANMYGIHYERTWMGLVRQREEFLFYGRYLDDTFTIVCAETPEEAMNKVSFIQLGGVELLWEQPTLSTNFLDLHIELKEGRIYHIPFVKSMSHRERIPWDSGHPLDVKKGTFASEISRLATLCSNQDDYLNHCKEAVDLYIGRGYPPVLVSSWLKSQKEKRWEDRVKISPRLSDNGGSNLFTLKTYFNEAWKYVNIRELENIIKAEWQSDLPPESSVLGKRKAGPSGPKKLKKRKTNGGASLEKYVQIEQPGNKQDEVRNTWLWINTGRFIVSRKKTKQLWDVTREWNRQVYTNFMETEGITKNSDLTYRLDEHEDQTDDFEQNIQFHEDLSGAPC
jgi:hypothetical protein